MARKPRTPIEREETLKLGFAGNPVEKKVKLKDAQAKPWDLDTKFTYVGKRIPRFDGLAKASGRAKYAYDINLPGMLYARIARAPIAAGKIVDIDTSIAEGMEGVKGVMNLKKAGDRILYQGQGIAAVCATTSELAEDAVRAILANYEKSPHVVTVDDAMRDGAPVVRGNSNKTRENESMSNPELTAEQLAKIIDSADVRMEGTFRTQVQTHSALETHGAVAHFTKNESGEPKLTVWASTQGTFSVLDGLCQRLGLERSQVEVICEYMGGGFGAKFGADEPTVVAAELARKTGLPVKCMLTRKEEHLCVGNRPDSVHMVKAGATRDGKIAGYEITNYGTGGIGGGAGARNVMIYQFQNWRKKEFGVLTNCGPACAMRAPAHPQGAFVLEQVIDELANKLGMDPIEFRVKNDPHPTRKAQFDQGRQLIQWERRNPKDGDGPLAGKGRLRRGIGVASATWANNGGRDGTAVTVAISGNGSVEVRNGCQDIGTGTRSIIGICAAEALGCPIEKIKVQLGRTRDPFGPASGGSVTGPTVTAAAKDAGHAAKLAFLDRIAKKLEIGSSNLDIQGGKVFVKSDPSKSWTWYQACELLGVESVEVTTERSDNFKAGFHGQVGGVQLAEVEVDVETGIVRVVKVVAIQDAGTVINRLTFESQILGGVIQGLSYALFENRIMDRKSGHMLNTNLESYKIAGALDMPEIVTVAFDVANGHNSSGVSGLGEPTVIPTAAAIANAIANATGARVRSLPMTPDVVLAALAEKAGAR